MSIPPSENEPQPVLPLEYFKPKRDAWRPMSRGVALLTLLYCGCAVLEYAVEVGCYFWQQSVPRAYGIWGDYLIITLARKLAELVVLIGSVQAVKLIDRGRRLIIAGSTMLLVIVPITDAFEAVYYHVEYNHARFGIPYVVMSFTNSLIDAFWGTLLPFFIWRYFQRPQVRDVFLHARD